jgi:indole-3-glycerol phosphate synthase
MNKLTEIFKHKELEVERAKASVSLSELKEMVAFAPRVRPFKKALVESGKPMALIAEVKKASPSKGVIRADFDPVQVAAAYRDAGADCLSVLTDERYFQGSRKNLELARGESGLPCLRKDFIFDEYQVYEARTWGADCILLILAAFMADTTSPDADQSLFTWDHCVRLNAIARDLGMDVLVEVHTQWEALRSGLLATGLTGVNNRNLSNMSTDIKTSEELLPLVSMVGQLGVSESALETRADLDRVQAAGARAVLIGTSFCAAPDIGAKVREVMGW